MHDDLSPRPDTPVEVWQPTGQPLPLVCDSPHSGTAYPDDFGHAVPLALLRRGEDTHVVVVPAAGRARPGLPSWVRPRP